MNLTLLEHENILETRVFDTEGLIDRFIASIDARINSKNTYRRQIKPFIDWILERHSCDNLRLLSQQDIFYYKDFLLKAGKSAYTISGYLTAVKNFLNG